MVEGERWTQVNDRKAGLGNNDDGVQAFPPPAHFFLLLQTDTDFKNSCATTTI